MIKIKSDADLFYAKRQLKELVNKVVRKEKLSPSELKSIPLLADSINLVVKGRALTSTKTKSATPTEFNSKLQTKSAPNTKPTVKVQSPMQTKELINKLSANDFDKSFKSKALVSTGVQAAIDQRFQAELIERARLQGGMFAQVDIEQIDSVKVKPSLIRIKNATVVEYIEQNGSGGGNGIVRDQTGDPEYFSPTVYMDEAMSKSVVSREVITDPAIDLVQHLLDDQADAFVERFAIDFNAGDSDTNKEFHGVLNGYYDDVESTKSDSIRGIEYLQVVKSGSIGSIGGTDPTVAGYALDNIRLLIETLPVKYRNGAQFFMHPNTWTTIKSLVAATGGFMLGINNTTIDGYEVVLDEFYPSADNTIELNLIAFGNINACMTVKSHPAPIDVNPFKVDGATTYESVNRMSSWMKANDAIRILRGKA